MHNSSSCTAGYTAGSTDLECVLTVKLELVFYASNVPIIHDLTGLGVAFRDLKQAVCGRDKLEVTCIARGSKERIKYNNL